MITRKEYMSDSRVMHRDYYAQFVLPVTIATVERRFGAETLTKALSEDKHLNNIPLKHWDKLTWVSLDPSRPESGPFRALLPLNRKAVEAAGETLTRATLVCIAKEAARQITDRNN